MYGAETQKVQESASEPGRCCISEHEPSENFAVITLNKQVELDDNSVGRGTGRETGTETDTGTETETPPSPNKSSPPCC